jgi:hypothetical protein
MTWVEQARGIVRELSCDLPRGLTRRQAQLWFASRRPHFFSVTSHGQKVWAREVSRFLQSPCNPDRASQRASRPARDLTPLERMMARARRHAVSREEGDA